MDIEQLELEIVQDLERFASASVVGFQSEFVVQHCVMETALRHPAIAIEVGTQGSYGGNRKEIKLAGNRPIIFNKPRTLPKGMSIDFMVCKPFEYTMEIKARSEFGSCDAAAQMSIADDIGRVLLQQVTAFVLVSDESIYRLISTNAQPNRIRKAEVDQYFDRISIPGKGERIFNGIRNRWSAVKAPGGNLRIICLMTRVKE